MNDLTRIAIEAQNAVKLDREAERNRPAHIVLAIIALCLAVYVSDRDYQDAVIAEAMHHDTVREYQASRSYPWNSPRCPKRNVSGDWLRVEYAHNPDGRGWMYGCTYVEAGL